VLSSWSWEWAPAPPPAAAPPRAAPAPGEAPASGCCKGARAGLCNRNRHAGRQERLVAQGNIHQQVRLLRKTAVLQGIFQVAGYSTNVKKVLTREGNEVLTSKLGK
jgi:hypothetical protein